VTKDEVTPAVKVPLESGEAYYLLDDHNHHHEHMVLAGSSSRYSSTHRVALTATDTYGYIRYIRILQGSLLFIPQGIAVHPQVNISGRCAAILAQKEGEACSAAELKEAEEAHSELEFEWLAQWGVQVHINEYSGSLLFVP